VRVCVMEAEEGTFQQESWVAMEGQWGDSKEEPRILHLDPKAVRKGV